MLVHRRQRREHRTNSRPARQWWRLGFGCSSLLLVLSSFLSIIHSLAYARLTADLPSLNAIPAQLDSINGQLLQPTRFYDRTGEHVLLSLENPGILRRYLPLDPQLPDHLSPQLVQATLSLVEPFFWSSPGFAFDSLLDEKPHTIAERLVNDLIMEDEQSGVVGALRMRLLAAQLVAHYGRSRVLEWYLNSASYGHLAYGADSAAQLYLGKPASELNLTESVLLASVADAPVLNPLDSPSAALERHQAALETLCFGGIIGADDCAQVRKEEIVLRELTNQTGETIAPAYSRMVLDQLSKTLGRKRIERGGLRVITSLDLNLQEQLVCVLLTQLSRSATSPESQTTSSIETCEAARLLPTLSFDSSSSQEGLAGSGLILDVKTGQVLALTGKIDRDEESNSIVRGQPGSLLSPFVALAGFARGYSPASLVWDIPGSIPATINRFVNPNEAYHGPQRLRLALANDYLVPLSQLLQQLNPANVWRQAESFGLTGLQTEDQGALLYDGGRVSILEIASAYNIFANLGEQPGNKVERSGRISPNLILQVEDGSGRVLMETWEPDVQSVLTPSLAYLVHDILSDEAARWSSLGYPNFLEIGRPAGAKIGQTAGGRESWAVGYTTEILSVIWIGLPESETGSATPVSTKLASGVWHAVMQYATRDQDQSNWTVPSGITQMDVCDPSGKLITQDCPVSVREVFLTGSEPTEYDTLYRVIQVNRETGKLATVFTPLELIEEKTFLVVPPDAADWAEENRLSVPPTVYDAIQSPEKLADVSFGQPAMFDYVSGVVQVKGTAAGDRFVSYRLQVGQGLNPRSWLQVGNESTNSVQNDVLSSWDTRLGQDGLYALRLTVLRQNQQLETAIIQVTVDNTPPTVVIEDPAEDQEIGPGSNPLLTLRADVTDKTGIERVVWNMDGNFIGLTRQTPHILLWNSTPGEHKLSLTAYDLAGNVTVSGPVSFSVNR